MKLKRSLVLALAFILALTTCAPSLAYDGSKKESNLRANKVQDFVKYLNKKQKNNNIVIPNFKNLKEDKEVRVVVELKKQPLATSYKTIKKGMLGASSTASKIARIEKQKRSLKREHNIVKDKLANGHLRDLGAGHIKYLDDFYVAINGFSAIMSVKDIKRVSKLPEVKKVYRSIAYKRPATPSMNTSHDIIKSNTVWNLGYKGEGRLVSIIDTGVDPSHKDMILSNSKNAKLSKKNAEEIAKILPGKYYTEKVPYGYNYADKSEEIRDLGPTASMHGMHVAGTVGANGDVKKGGIKGVAPECQLLAMKVFGNGEGLTYSDIYVKAIEDSIILGADSMNMSLGADANFVPTPDQDPTVTAIENARRAGIVIAIAAGNADRFGAGDKLPLAKNPDTGLVGHPGLVPDSLCVSSIEDTTVMRKLMQTSDSEIKDVIYKSAEGVIEPTTLDKPQKLVYCGLGKKEDFTDELKAKLKGNIALISRGEISFSEKILPAQEAGAVGAIIFNSKGDELMNMMVEKVNIPSIFIGQTVGEKLRDKITKENAADITVTFDKNLVAVHNSHAGTMSSFTSWGLTPDLQFKPEITAPGGQIYSTLNDNKYGTMSGTSMATPHVAGGIALVNQYLEEQQVYAGNDLYEMTKNLLMSTAKAHQEKNALGNKYFVSPRRQGAGVMDLEAALKTKAIVVNPYTNQTKVALKTIGAKTGFPILVKNFGDKEITYKIETPVFTDIVIDGQIQETAAPIVADNLTTVIKDGNKINHITVPAQSEAKFYVKLDLYGAKTSYDQKPLLDVYPNGSFVDGFVILKDELNGNPELSIPFTGFYGNWAKAPIIDLDLYKYNAERLGYDKHFYDDISSAMLGEENGELQLLGMDQDGNFDSTQIGFSPNGDKQYDFATPLLTFLRNVRAIEIDVLDKEGNVVAEVTRDEYYPKNHFAYGDKKKFTTDASWNWDGKSKGKQLTSGDYIFQIRTKVDYPGATFQTFELPTYIDIEAPQFIEEPTYNKETGKLTAKAKDNRSKSLIYFTLVDGEIAEDNRTGEFEVSKEDFANHKYQLAVIDNLFNVTTSDVLNPEGAEPEPQPEKDTVAPEIVVVSPVQKEFKNSNEAFVNKNNVEIKGFVNEKALDKLTIEGKEVKFKDAVDGKYQFTYNFKTKKEGKYNLSFVAVDKAGNKAEKCFIVNVDTTAPTIKVPFFKDGHVKKVLLRNRKNHYISGKVKDNTKGVKLTLNDKVIFDNSDNASFARYKKHFNDKVKLNKKKTAAVLKATDLAGNETTYTIYFEKR